MSIHQKIQTFCNAAVGEHHRYRSWEHCYRYFRSNRTLTLDRDQAALDCNLHKGTNLTGIDPETKEVTELFDPRHEEWKEHFEWQEIYVVGRTAMAGLRSECSI